MTSPEGKEEGEIREIVAELHDATGNPAATADWARTMILQSYEVEVHSLENGVIHAIAF